MAVNGLLTLLMFEKNPDRVSFTSRRSFPLNWMHLPPLTRMG